MNTDRFVEPYNKNKNKNMLSRIHKQKDLMANYLTDLEAD